MRKCLIGLMILCAVVMPVRAESFSAPPTPDSAVVMVPEEPETFSEGLATVLREAVNYIYPSLRSGAATCLGVIAAILLASMVQNIPGATKRLTDMVATITVAFLLFSSTGALIRLGAETVTELSEYGRLLLPIMTTVLAAQGGVATSTALYAGTVLFDSILSGLISSVITPMLYIFLCLAVVSCATGEMMVAKMVGFMKWAMTWALKIVLYTFTGYMGITGVISGSTDAAAMKAAKLTISGMVPVVGNILSDASEAVLVSAGLVKNAIGVYGATVIIALWIRPFIQIGTQYLMLKLTAGICSIFDVKSPVSMISHFTGAMGMLLAMTGAVSLLLMVSVVCLMRGAT